MGHVSKFKNKNPIVYIITKNSSVLPVKVVLSFLMISNNVSLF